MNELTKSGYDMLYLSLCAINDITPNRELLDKMNTDLLFSICRSNSLTALVCCALEKVVTPEHRWLEAKGKAIRKNLLLDIERGRITAFMNECGIKHMPLKGVILKELYPQAGMRQMADNDIWYDEKYSKELEVFMKKLGYTDISVGGNHDCYKRPPIYNFEMHRTLFSRVYEPFYSYYTDLDRLLITDSDSGYACHFSNEDFYVFMIAHEYKHYSYGGTGFRSILDCCVYLKKYGDKLNFKYIEKETDKLQLSNFEQKQRRLCKKLNEVQLDTLDTSEQEMLEYCFLSGTYGNMENLVSGRLKKLSDSGKITSKTKRRYVISRIFPPMEFYKIHYPFFYKHKALIPLCFFIRAYNGIFKKRINLKKEIQIIKSSD